MRKTRALSAFLLLAILLVGVAVPGESADAQVGGTASTAGFGGAFAFALRVGPIASSTTATVGTGMAAAYSVSPVSAAASFANSHGFASAWSSAVGTPSISGIAVVVRSAFGGVANAGAMAFP